jgi:predicted unusual protein kinase regulating ubiquinone biosynthesis (AarF/ABC1/UbiB family)
MLALLEQELGAPPDDIFGEFDRRVLAAASLGQVYRARLKNGDRVVVRFSARGSSLVATDLAALRQVARWTMAWDLIRKRADVPALEEFGRTLWQELDYESEAQNARRFTRCLKTTCGFIYRRFTSNSRRAGSLRWRMLAASR